MYRNLPALFATLTVLTSIAQAEDSKSLVAPDAKVKKLASGMKFTEGPVWLPSEKKLVFSDIPNSKLMQWSEADGKELEQIDVPEGPANVCFGGDDFKTLFITARTSLYSVRMKHPGAKPRGAK